MNQRASGNAYATWLSVCVSVLACRARKQEKSDIGWVNGKRIDTGNGGTFVYVWLATQPPPHCLIISTRHVKSICCRRALHLNVRAPTSTFLLHRHRHNHTRAISAHRVAPVFDHDSRRINETLARDARVSTQPLLMSASAQQRLMPHLSSSCARLVYIARAGRLRGESEWPAARHKNYLED